MGSLKWLMLMIHTKTHTTAMAFDRKVPNSSSLRFRGVVSSVVSDIACLQPVSHPYRGQPGHVIQNITHTVAKNKLGIHLHEQSCVFYCPCYCLPADDHIVETLRLEQYAGQLLCSSGSCLASAWHGRSVEGYTSLCDSTFVPLSALYSDCRAEVRALDERRVLPMDSYTLKQICHARLGPRSVTSDIAVQTHTRGTASACD